MRYIFLFLSFFVSANALATLQPTNLQCEYKNSPLGIDVMKPRFSWQFVMSGRNQLQTAYEIIVSDNLADIQSTKGLIWASGKIVSNQNTNIEYAGKDLKSFTIYYWRVRAYGEKDNIAKWSEPAMFETAMLQQSDWRATWISDGSKQFEHDEDFYQEDRMPLFRKEFTVTKKVSKARLYIAGIGYHEVYFNGEKIGHQVLDPGWTTYKKEVSYVVHDITSSLIPGKNVSGVMLGNGWWNPLPLRLFGQYNLRDVQQTGRPCLKAEIHIRYSDGSSEIILTDESWETAPGPVIRNSVFLGEHYDARLEQKNWNTSNADKKAWKNAAATSGPSGILTSQKQPPINITTTIKPISITEIKPGIFIADMGQNFAGVAKIRVKGKPGTQIKLKYGENIHADGSLNFLTTMAGHIKSMWNLKGGPGAPADAWQEDRYTLKGSATEVWSPRFTFHGFRFVEISGWPGKPTVNDIEGLRMNSSLQKTGEFECSNEMFNQLHSITQWTFLSNVFSVQSDCPGREKMGYGADMVTTANAYLYNYDMSNFYTKAVQDFVNEQQPDGGITEIAPYTGIADRGVGGESGPLGWQLAFPYLQKRLYDFYGDEKIIATHYDAFARQIDFLQSKAFQGLFHWDISDHVAIDPRPEAFTASAFYYHHAMLATEFAGILKKTSDSVRFAKLSQQIKRNIVAKYLIPNTGRFDNATQSAQLFALWYDLSPEKEKSFEVLMDEFKRHKMHVSSGIFGVMMMFDVLREKDQNEVAYQIANQRDYPGWGYMLSKGATTLWESWEYPDNAPSQNHPMFGSIDEWFYRSLLGINPAAPGFKKIIIKPQPAGDLVWAKGSYHSIQGKITSNWKIEKDRFKLTVSIPANTRAEIWIRTKPDGEITESGKSVKTNSDIRFVKYDGAYAVVEIGSGEYGFESDLK